MRTRNNTVYYINQDRNLVIVSRGNRTTLKVPKVLGGYHAIYVSLIDQGACVDFTCNSWGSVIFKLVMDFTGAKRIALIMDDDIGSYFAFYPYYGKVLLDRFEIDDRYVFPIGHVSEWEGNYLLEGSPTKYIYELRRDGLSDFISVFGCNDFVASPYYLSYRDGNGYYHRAFINDEPAIELDDAS